MRRVNTKKLFLEGLLMADQSTKSSLRTLFTGWLLGEKDLSCESKTPHRTSKVQDPIALVRPCRLTKLDPGPRRLHKVPPEKTERLIDPMARGST